MTREPNKDQTEPFDYEGLVDEFSHALTHTLRQHNVAQRFLDFWVPDTDPVRGIVSMIDSARISGMPSIAILLRKTTVPAERLPELEQAVAKYCTLIVESGAEQVILRAMDMKQTAAADARSGARTKPTYWQPRTGLELMRLGTPPHGWESDELPAFGDVHPRFRSALSAVSGELAFEGGEGLPASGNLVGVTGREGPVTLTFVVDPHTDKVHAARYAGASKPSERAILDLFCKAAEGLPIEEVADHTALSVLQSLVDDDAAPPVAGVLLPINAGAPFLLPARLARQAYNAYCAETEGAGGTSFYYEPPGKAWQSLSAEQRGAKVDDALRGFLQSEGLNPDDIGMLRIENNKYGFPVRVTVSFSERVKAADKPHLMRKLERRLRRDIEAKLDLIAERAKDTSPLRRLS